MKHNSLLIGASLLLASSAGVQAQEIATWKGFRACAVTYSFDDNWGNQIDFVKSAMDKYDYKATFNVVTNWVNGGNSHNTTWNSWKEMSDNGHEVASHTDSHQQQTPSNELGSSKNTIQQKMGKECITIAYPNCNVPSDQNALQSNYISGRICNGQIEGKTPRNWYQIGSIICGNQGINSGDQFISKMNQAKSQSGWVTFLIHGVDNGDYSPTSSNALKQSVDHIAQNDKDFWCCTFAAASKYIKERDAAKASKKSESGSSITFTLTDNLDDKIYNEPLSLRYKNPGWSTVSGTQGGKKIEAYILSGYVYFDAVPDAGDIVLNGDGSTGGGDDNNGDDNNNTGDNGNGNGNGNQGNTGSDDPNNPCNYTTKLSGGTKITNTNRTGNTSNGYQYEIWRDGNGGALTLYDKDACFKAEWDNAGDYLGRVGKTFNNPQWNNLGGDLIARYAYEKSGDDGGSYSYIGIYGWMDSPQIEYYVVDDWLHARGTPGGSYIGKSYGIITVDGIDYEVWSGSRTGASKWGNSTFTQIFSIRQEDTKNQVKERCGVINLSEHFRQWDKLGLNLGKVMEAQILAESGGGKGYVDFTYATVKIETDYKPIVTDPQQQEDREPYLGEPIAIPGKVEAENYDKGGKNVAYYDTDNKNEGGKYREDGVDIVAVDGGYAVGYTTDAEWLEYTVNVADDDEYDVSAYMANGSKDPKINLLVDGKKVCSLTAEGQGDWDTYAMAKGKATLTKGEHTLRIEIAQSYTNLDYVEFVGKTTSASSVKANSVVITPNPASSSISIISGEEIENVEVLDMLGKAVINAKSSKIDVSGLSNGVYVVKIRTASALVTKRVTIKK